MLRVVKPKNARSKRALSAREPKLVEGPKVSIFVKSSQTSEKVRLALTELYQIKSSVNSIQFSKKNLIHPFEDPSSLQFWSIKNDASLFLVGSDSKKRPDNLTFVRMFDHQVLDMVEVGIEGAVSLKDFKGPKITPGLIPLFQFVGSLWESNDRCKCFKSILLDFFRGEQINSIDLVQGLQLVISLTIPEIGQAGENGSLLNSSNVLPASSETETSAPTEQTNEHPEPVSLVAPPSNNIYQESNNIPLIHFRTYTVQLLKSGQREPRVELMPHGPFFDFRLRRTQIPSDELLKMANKRPTVKKVADKSKKVKGNKNVDIDEMGDKVGKIHVGKQDLSTLQSRKMKGLKKDKRQTEEDESEDNESIISDIVMDDGNLSAGASKDSEEMGAVVEVSGSKVIERRSKK
ncbi:Brix domain-containing protein [Phakopsora pachyrhizi]|uniref:Ribosome production factor 2 homolog n=1 Tax=Phakopsora pachyrhizi TaxID=170000 RepID=A0AAV0AQS7_PHAPC|nr:Brix domain-containing protein [Phakopsora pachyrhizi]CAH7671516.1 Brix domain-domain-containing protein [Phakopsora pachyrhizi]